jgi:hypothetical protein
MWWGKTKGHVQERGKMPVKEPVKRLQSELQLKIEASNFGVTIDEAHAALARIARSQGLPPEGPPPNIEPPAPDIHLR